MEFPLECACGRRLRVSEGQAGTTQHCKCGQAVVVPNLRELRRRFPEEVEEAEEEALQAEENDRLTLQIPKLVIYCLVVSSLLLTTLPLFLTLVYYQGVLAGLGLLLLVGGQLWLFTLIYVGNPLPAFVVLFVPILGFLLTLHFSVQHWRLACWPLLCQVVGLFLLFSTLVTR